MLKAKKIMKKIKNVSLVYFKEFLLMTINTAYDTKITLKTYTTFVKFPITS